ncbi:MAG: hypothetical protein CEE40_08490 [Chloroflexi bacterium B3_Chlor]|nr:MAG: hypothetical protein CEE40_08490 [Chloroflexi bacterium B3_Chlor]
MTLPDDWWRRLDVARRLSEWFSRHLLCLFVSYETGARSFLKVYTGFLLYYLDCLFWVTAGHVIDQLSELLSSGQVEVERMRWLDGCEIPGAEAVVVHNRELLRFSAFSQGLDFGLVAILGLDAENIIKGGRAEPMTEQIWRNLDVARPDGYYLLGYPDPWIEHGRKRVSNSQVRRYVRAPLSCLPLSPIGFRSVDPEHEFWDDPEGFYGKILPFVEGEACQPESIVGMSGGPVLSVERDSDLQIRYRLFGIQSKWWGSKRLTCAVPIEKVVGFMEERKRSAQAGSSES